METKNKLTLKDIRAACGNGNVEISKNRENQAVFRLGFFYRNGCTAEVFQERVLAMLAPLGVTHSDVAECQEIWKPFRGGASTANSSHWVVKINL